MTKNLEHSKLYQSEGVRLLYSNSLPGILITFIAATTLAFTFTNNNLHAKVIWWLVMTAILAVRVVDTRMWLKSTPEGKSRKSWTMRFSCGCLLTALMWSLYAVIFYQQFSIEELSSTNVILAAMAGGATSILSANFMLASIYNIIILIPMSVLLMMQPEQYKINLGGLGICFTIIMIISSARSANYIKEAILLRYRNKKLVSRMEETIRIRTQEVYEISNKDSLTRLYNRTAFLSAVERVEQDFNQHHITGFAIFFIDLDGFKNINDTLGHNAGDNVLVNISERLKSCNAADTLMCRWGGDEFILLVKENRHQTIRALAQKITATLSQPIDLGDQTITLNATIGISVCPEHDTSVTRLIQLADIAMYSQKGKYPERMAFYNLNLEHNLHRKIMLNEALKCALERQELRLVYQPIVDSAGQIVSFEALLRWHYQDQEISPVEFIPLLEQSGRIVEIGSWVLEEACKMLVTLRQGHAEICMCVNISLIQFYDKDFVNNVKQVIEQQAIPGHLLHLEVTESIFQSEQMQVNHKVSQLQKCGVKFSVDDFGTGYSSLSVIQNMNIDYIKIDRSFIQHIENKGLSIVQAVMDMSKTLNFRVIAEGVETETQRHMLEQCGIPYMQGYFFSRPMERQDALAYLGDASHKSE
ncbi:phosphodiesterase [Buttiauxella sp. 3AFRM03]|uniref:putative bifunctional diguanylate cyclase/phosphodiesterase n=1 Tax=Buttiauxella TaxID=82976 RepID=UPI000EF7BB19|nr:MULTISPECIES: GGDEF domain-containing phosphodiesterase [Buttiauxella]AYN25873.1 phosphodiesterase [Buttiauxella sp. 3AFRM03]MCE0824868.1 EAL domain-containing protein [Buttiauxella ferragutiae]TDN54097.1 diguanylate cyclase/phosphodiesterase [Buttiauxella sp. JUb87]UNK59426.1 EAL domain-containing protein [Buttiauxella ferragutiae]